MKFRAEQPVGEVDVLADGTQIVVHKAIPGKSLKETSRLVFSDEPVSKFGDDGHWFEIRVDELWTGNMSLMAIGFTATPPESLMEGDEAAECPKRAWDVPRTYVVGYTRSCYLDGNRLQVDELCTKIQPGSVFTLGANLTPAGILQVFINRRIAYSIDPQEQGLEPIPVSEPLYAVIDGTSGLKKAVLVTDSRPPVEGEEEAAEAEKAAAAAAAAEAAAAAAQQESAAAAGEAPPEEADASAPPEESPPPS
mmetsp:Transcript_8898/g.19927  ORF Transcript_8898/g.19927 Transcript_8898/m.19927 type:complete len:251 (-) Transcript_8898:199-951(-)|eukprot:CAMPEP_0178384396 /NCGR_PEP_ID=MMETSP0689_2-20121128/7493_1 /TAXON_ID=160604 /ORGANISM="Amphidinium massartii, Strain CS-259" /LENGTH=250 /DNA_ID=CAMNT_0020004641 /DNA_START=20 /DNA_END=772 /DNA_ORIENTATION=+